MLALPLLILQGHYSPPRELSSTPPPPFAVKTFSRFGLRSASFLFNQPLTAIHWILLHKYSIHHSLQCHSVWYCCRMSCGCYLSPHAAQFAIFATCHAVCSLLPHAMQFTTCCRMLCNLLFIATCHAVAICCHMPYSLLFVAFVPTCRTVCYLLLHAMQFAICCCMPCCLLIVAICPHMPYSLLLVAVCHAICYLLPRAMQFAICC